MIGAALQSAGPHEPGKVARHRPSRDPEALRGRTDDPREQGPGVFADEADQVFVDVLAR
jgi:hypothetical protein